VTIDDGIDHADNSIPAVEYTEMRLITQTQPINVGGKAGGNRRLNPYTVALCAVVVVAAIPRALRLTSSLWYDETFASRLKLSFSPQGFAWMFYDTHPPLYNLIMLLWNHLFGESELSLRMLPFLCSLTAIGLAAKIARDIAGKGEALVLGLLMALSGASVYYAHEARSYSFIVLLFLLMIYFLLKYGHSAGAKDLRWFFLLSLLCSISHLYSMVFMLCLTAALLLRVAQPRNVVAILRLALLQLVLIVPFYFSVVLMTLFTREHAYLSEFTERLSAPQVAELFSFFMFGYVGLNAYWPVHVFALVIFLTGLILLLRRLHRQSQHGGGGCPSHTFTFAGMNTLFVAVAAVGLVLFTGIAASPWFLRRDLFATLFPGQEHRALMAHMLELVSRTAFLYLGGYVLAVVLWILLGTRSVVNRLERQAASREERSLGMGRWMETVILFPLLGFLPVVVLSHLWPSYNPRYMLALLPLLLLPIAVSVRSLPAP